ncbi:MAG: hypothetical protein DRQ59_11930 [Gammaproteobacteria bacterium]|nr:MAG: hypothetical protein DRQ59_11930 [Gammaproteobacteria bacterium]
MYFDIFVNGKKRATVGHDDLENVSISVSGNSEGVSLISGAVCKEGVQNYHIHWFQDDLAETDEVSIRRSNATEATEPQKIVKMGDRNRSADGERFCDFCKLSENEVGKLVQTGSTPTICENCVDLCVEILRGVEK